MGLNDEIKYFAEIIAEVIFDFSYFLVNNLRKWYTNKSKFRKFFEIKISFEN